MDRQGLWKDDNPNKLNGKVRRTNVEEEGGREVRILQTASPNGSTLFFFSQMYWWSANALQCRPSGARL